MRGDGGVSGAGDGSDNGESVAGDVVAGGRWHRRTGGGAAPGRGSVQEAATGRGRRVQLPEATPLPDAGGGPRPAAGDMAGEGAQRGDTACGLRSAGSGGLRADRAGDGGPGCELTRRRCGRGCRRRGWSSTGFTSNGWRRTRWTRCGVRSNTGWARRHARRSMGCAMRYARCSRRLGACHGPPDWFGQSAHWPDDRDTLCEKLADRLPRATTDVRGYGAIWTRCSTAHSCGGRCRGSVVQSTGLSLAGAASVGGGGIEVHGAVEAMVIDRLPAGARSGSAGRSAGGELRGGGGDVAG